MTFDLQLLDRAAAEHLFSFEQENRNFFEKSVPGRGDDYYEWENFLRIHDSLLKEQAEGKSYFYLIRNDAGQLAGRINIVDIEDGTGHVGYRVGISHTGKGAAGSALALLKRKAGELGIRQLRAKVLTNNPASQKVLEKNQFIREYMEKEAVWMNGEMAGFIHYSWQKDSDAVT
ncbi:GNAT family N-acetyltransferase [Peribacillus sp. SCS-26]|uniref:GNAT family N-acetyltransferase n=1 Tax=Paraperibacillus marinus TaxID=3115295 RepID=UPI0039059FE9